MKEEWDMISLKAVIEKKEVVLNTEIKKIS